MLPFSPVLWAEVFSHGGAPCDTPDMVNVTTSSVALAQHERRSATTTIVGGLQDADCV